MYKQNFIDSIGEQKFYDLLDGKVQFNLDINDLSSKHQQIYYAFQHFLIKAYTSGYNKQACINYFNKYYRDFYAKPYAFCDSPLITDKVLQLFGEDFKKQVVEFRSKYYNIKVASNLYNKRKTQELTLDEKNQYFSYLIVLLNRKIKDKKYDQLFENEIQRIIDSDYNKLTDMELKFYAQYVSKFSLEYRDIRTVVMIGTDPSTLRGYESNDYIFINKRTINSIEFLTQTTAHETRHSIQEHDSVEDNTLAGFEMAQMRLFFKYLNTESYDSYHRNYRYSTIELDAEHHGHWNACVFLSMFKKHDLAEKVRQNRKDTYDNRNDYSFMIDENNKPLTVDEFIVKNLDKIIRENPSEIQKYIVLKNMYNMDGTRKPFQDLVRGKMSENIDNRGIYDNYINYGILNGELNSISLDRFNKDDMKRFAQSFSFVYRKYIIELKDYFNDTSSKTNPNQVFFAVSYKLSLAYQLLSYIEANYDKIINNIEVDHFNNQHPIFDFIIDLRDYDINLIKNESIKNNPALISHILKVKEKSNEIIKKFNNTFINNRIDSLPLEIRRSEIASLNGETVNFETYFKKEILSKMDSHQEIEFNGNKYYVGSLIRIYTKQVTEQLGTNKTEENGYGPK